MTSPNGSPGHRPKRPGPGERSSPRTIERDRRHVEALWELVKGQRGNHCEGNMSTVAKVTGAELLSSERRVIEEKLVREHLPLVHYVVSDMAGRIPRHVSRDDLESAAMAGLAQAARSFDPDRGIAFERYAATRIRGALLDELRGRDWASRSVRSKARKLSAAAEDLTNNLGRTPTIEELADHLGVEKRSIESVNDDVHRAVVLNFDSVLAAGDAEHIMPAETQSPDVVILERERRSYLMDAV